MTESPLEAVWPLLEAPSPAVLTTYRKDGGALVSPVWFRFVDGWFEVVIAQGDLKLRHLARDPRCILVVFEAVRPFRGVEVRGVPELVGATSAPHAPRSRAATSAPPTARASPQSGRPTRESCSGSPTTAPASGTCPGSCAR